MGVKLGKKTIPALKVRQWLAEWEEIHWKPDQKRAEPPHWFYQFSMSAKILKALSGVYPRSIKQRTRASKDLGIQRGHDKRRSDEISKYVKYGYPWSNLSEAKRESGDFQELRQPGWLPTAIVVNILTPDDVRRGRRVAPSDLIEIKNSDNDAAEFLLPGRINESWYPQNIPPIEVIDGQHRLWAFDDNPLQGDYELPVVAFVGLDLSWQAYLFYTINIKPKKINPSLAFDLYPLLRTEEWLTKFEGHVIYRETRAQELVDLLWSHSQSPWLHRINMLGEKGHKKGLMVTQASWVRSLLTSFVKSWEGRGRSIGGLFGSLIGEHNTVLPWIRQEQAAFLIVVGQTFQKAISDMNEPWMKALREEEYPHLDLTDKDLAFFGPNNLLNSDQGIRSFLQVINDLCFVESDKYDFHQWGGSQYDTESDSEQIDASITALIKGRKIYNYLKKLSNILASYDWRTSSSPGLTEKKRVLKASFRGSGGYKELRREVLKHVLSNGERAVAEPASRVLNLLGY